MVRQALHTARPPSGLVMVMLRVPVAALVATVRVKLTCDADGTVTAVAVTPVPDTATFAPLVKLLPLTWAEVVVPRPTVLGLIEVAVGAGMTVKQAEQLMVLLPVVTATSRDPVMALAATTMAATSLVELGTLTDLTVIPEPAK